MEPNLIKPAPWVLSGNGVVLLYHFPTPFVKQYGFMEPYQQRGYKGWLGAVMLVNYETSDVGPYREILFLPGLFHLNGKITFSISKIYVSTLASVRSGHRNWGIPKELADFTFNQLADGTQVFMIEKDERMFFEATIKPRGFRLPFTSMLLPISRIAQRTPEQLLLTKPSAKGKIRLASLKKSYANPEFFPPIHQLKPLLTLSISKFSMRFPIAQNLK